MKKLVLFLLVMTAALFLVDELKADDIKGYMIPEYYSVISHHDGDEGIEGQHGLWFRRIYFGYNTKLSDKLSARLRLEMNSPAYGEGTMGPYVKNAHLKYSLGGGAGIIFGVIEPPSFNKQEKFWGLRFLEKTAPDLYKMASSRDIGIALDGKTRIGLVYTVMYGNYGSNKGEDNAGKGFYGRFGYKAESFYVEANGHFSKDGSKKYMYLSGFGGFKGSFGRLGLGYYYKNQDPDGGDSVNTGVISAFAAVNMGKKAEAVLRYDHFTKENLKDPGSYLPVASTAAPARLVIAGVNLKLHKMFQLMPNIKFVFYGDPDTGDKPGSDFYFLITGKISFKTKI